MRIETLIVGILSTLVCGCATTTTRFGSAGLRLNDQNQIVWMKPNGIAAKAGLQLNDKITAIDGTSVATCPELFETILDSPNKDLQIEIDRNLSAKKIGLTTETKTAKGSRNYARELIKLVSCNRKINLILLVTNVENNMPLPPGMDEKKWATAKRDHIHNDWARGLLEALGKAPNFQLVEREALTNLFEELKLQISGAISAESAKRLGQMSGASHLLLIQFARFPDGYNNFKDVYSSRLLEVESGRVLAVDQNAIDKNGKQLRL